MNLKGRNGTGKDLALGQASLHADSSGSENQNHGRFIIDAATGLLWNGMHFCSGKAAPGYESGCWEIGM